MAVSRETGNEIYFYQFIDLHWRQNRVFTYGPGDRGSIPGRVLPKIQNMIPDTSLLDTQYYKVRINGNLEQSWKKGAVLVV